jgi:pre-rRNA-processing protein TSR4
MSLLVQLNGDLPKHFPGHERRLYIFGCQKKPCRRKNGCIRALRAVKTSTVNKNSDQVEDDNNLSAASQQIINPQATPPHSENNRIQQSSSLGETLFGVKPLPRQSNPFAAPGASSAISNPFSSNVSGTPVQAADQPSNEQKGAANALPETFAQKLRVSSQSTNITATAPKRLPWPENAPSYPSYHLDADQEYLDSDPTLDSIPSNAHIESNGESSNVSDDKAAFESAMDKTFQHFADRISQNPEQVLRYEYAGKPLLYAKNDAVGKLFSTPPSKGGKVQTAASGTSNSRVPRCANCGAARVFEMQLAPHAITELESEDVGVDGMDWGTIIVCVCSKDCLDQSRMQDGVGYVEEWVGVQWEELTPRR